MASVFCAICGYPAGPQLHLARGIGNATVSRHRRCLHSDVPLATPVVDPSRDALPNHGARDGMDARRGADGSSRRTLRVIPRPKAMGRACRTGRVPSGPSHHMPAATRTRNDREEDRDATFLPSWQAITKPRTAPCQSAVRVARQTMRSAPALCLGGVISPARVLATSCEPAARIASTKVCVPFDNLQWCCAWPPAGAPRRAWVWRRRSAAVDGVAPVCTPFNRGRLPGTAALTPLDPAQRPNAHRLSRISRPARPARAG